jgi:DNA (cytosine-5)-methyltransferase 1
MLRVIREARPAWIIGENVAGIVNLALDTVCADLEAEGYEVEPIIIPACAVDAPHRRDRVWIIGKYVADPMCNGRKGLREQVGNIGKVMEGRSDSKVYGISSFARDPANEKSDSESFVGRVADGIPNRTHRLKGLGNAVVPQVAAEIIRNINIIMEQP